MPITQVALSNTFNEFRSTVNNIANTVNSVAPVTLGGTGLATLTANSLMVGSGTANVIFVSPGSANNVLTSNGTNWSSTALPAAGLSYVYKTANYTTQNLEGVLANTAAVGAFTVTLPAYGGLSVGSQVVISDAGNFWGTNNLTIGRNGATISDTAADLVCDINGASVQLVYDGTTWEVYSQVGGNGGNVVVGPGSATDNAITRFDATTGKIIQNSLVTIADDGAITAPAVASVIPFYYANTTVFPSAATYHGAVAHSNANGAMYFAHSSNWVRMLDDATDVTVAQGGTGLSTLTANSVIIGNGTSSPLFVAPSSNGNVLTSNGTNWTSTAPAGAGNLTGAVTSVGLATSLGSFTSANLLAALTDETGTGSAVFATSPTLVTPLLGTPTSGNLSNTTVDGTDAVGFRNIPQNSQSAAYTLVLADAGKHIFHPVADNNARTFTIPANSSVAYPIGTALTFINMAVAVVSIAITTDTLTLSSAGTTGTRSLAQYGSATCIKITSTSWLISGSGLT